MFKEKISDMLTIGSGLIVMISIILGMSIAVIGDEQGNTAYDMGALYIGIGVGIAILFWLINKIFFTSIPNYKG